MNMVHEYTDAVPAMPFLLLDQSFYEQDADGTIPILEWYQYGLVGSGASPNVDPVFVFGEPMLGTLGSARGFIGGLSTVGLLALGSGGALHDTSGMQAPSGPAISAISISGRRQSRRHDAEVKLPVSRDETAVQPPDSVPFRDKSLTSIGGSLGQTFVSPPIGVAERLAIAQDQLSLSITDTAYVLGVSRPTIYSWISGATPHRTGARRLAALARATSLWVVNGGEPLGNYLHSHLEDGTSIRALLRSYVRASDDSAAVAEAALNSAFAAVHSERKHRDAANAIFMATRIGDQRSISEIVKSYTGKEDDAVDVRRRIRLASRRTRTRS